MINNEITTTKGMESAQKALEQAKIVTHKRRKKLTRISAKGRMPIST